MTRQKRCDAGARAAVQRRDFEVGLRSYMAGSGRPHVSVHGLESGGLRLDVSRDRLLVSHWKGLTVVTKAGAAFELTASP